MTENQTERKKIYSIDRLTVTALSTPHADRSKLPGLKLPFEIQGHGESFPDEGRIDIKFPKGDIFLSYVTTIHELGHPRQEELNPELERGSQTGPDVAAEADAWLRGWERFVRANPGQLAELEQRFQTYRQQGKLGQHQSFASLYRFVERGAADAVRAQRNFFEKTGVEIKDVNEEQAKELVREFEQQGWNDFVQQYEQARVGEQVNEDEIRTAITKTAELIISE